MTIRPQPPIAAAMQFAPVPDAPGRARDFLTDFLRAARAEQYLDDGRLVVSELVTNAVEHAGTPLSVDLTPTGAGLEIGVRDDGPGRPRITPAGQRGSGGRGLRIIARITYQWGVQIAERGGKRVWCQLPTHPQPVGHLPSA